jgi:predicted DNA binding protein
MNTPADDTPGAAPTPTEVAQVALEMGYFDVPRRASLAQVATRVSLPDTAASTQLRRGIRHSLEQTLPPDPPD